MLRASNLVKTYRGPRGTVVPVLRGVNLAVKAGELAVITGTSGSGTVVQLLSQMSNQLTNLSQEVTQSGEKVKARTSWKDDQLVVDENLVLPPYGRVPGFRQFNYR